ncbi:MAG: 50S ribosomal protein L3 [Actinomycetota bacterium]
MKAIIGRKLGMTQLFTEDGARLPVTVIEAGPCPIVGVRTAEADGYDGVQLAYEAVDRDAISKPEAGHLATAGVGPHKHLREFRGTTELAVGEAVTVSVFGPGDHIKVSGTSVGKGFAGTIKRHNFSRGPVTHGSHNVRAPGSIGQSAWPSRVFKGKRMAGQMCNERVTQRGLTVIDVDPQRNVLLVSGAVPGPTGGLVEIREDAH